MMKIPTCTLCLLALLLSAPREMAAQQDQSKPTNPVVTKIEGWTVKVDPILLNEQKQAGSVAMKALANHLQRISYIMPADKLKELRQLPIWIEFRNPKLKNMQYHPSKGWLASHGQDVRLEKHVHIPVAASLTHRQMWAKHPYVILHELAHAYHDQVLGFRHRKIIAVFKSAQASKKYEKVLDHRGRNVRHYGLNNPQEFFAEATEAYFGVNDFYPFVRAELKKHDPETFALMETVWGRIR